VSGEQRMFPGHHVLPVDRDPATLAWTIVAAEPAGGRAREVREAASFERFTSVHA